MGCNHHQIESSEKNRKINEIAAYIERKFYGTPCCAIKSPPRGCSKSPQKRPFLGVEGGTIFEVTVRKYLGDFFSVFLPFLGGSFTRIFSPIFFPDKPSKILHFSMHFPALGGLISSTLSGKYKGLRFRRFFLSKIGIQLPTYSISISRS